VKYSSVANLTVDDATNQHVLSSPVGETWSSISYNPKTIAAVNEDLAKNSVPPLTRSLLAQRFADTNNLVVKPVDDAPNQWSIISVPVNLTLNLQRTRVT